MPNPLYTALGGNKQPGMMGEFWKFAQQMQGVNAQQMINNMLQSGQISVQQLNEAQRQAQEFMSMIKR